LAEELKEELGAKNLPDDITAIIDDLVQNQQKINFHGKRADSIVKGMLQHSRKSTGQKEPTNINQLADEYLRLSYHGLRAKDKTFNVTIQTSFDESLKKVNIIPQEIGRVLLNLYTNAFHAVMKKKKEANESYEPIVSVKTSCENNTIKLCVRDNGNGIPAENLNKIFQPFFTTKPAGEGTGLGLSLSYDIITKGHGGSISVHSQEGEYAEFVIILPV
jgi:two-component system NtrC family sensor kinase